MHAEKLFLGSLYLTHHHCGVPRSSQLHRDEWDIRANARTVLLSRHHGRSGRNDEVVGGGKPKQLVAAQGEADVLQPVPPHRC